MHRDVCVRLLAISMLVVRSGVVADWVEIFGSESRIQRYMFVFEVVAACPSLNLVVHDDACHMARYCRHVNRFADATTEKGLIRVVCVCVCVCMCVRACVSGI